MSTNGSDPFLLLKAYDWAVWWCFNICLEAITSSYFFVRELTFVGCGFETFDC